LQLFAKSKKIKIEEYETCISFDYAISWLNQKDKDIDCFYFFNFWNIVSDVANLMGEQFYGNTGEDRINHLYNKLLYGNNSLSLSKHKNTISQLNDEEMFEFQKLVQDGLKLVDTYF
jgi:hypothetical protein